MRFVRFHQEGDAFYVNVEKIVAYCDNPDGALIRLAGIDEWLMIDEHSDVVSKILTGDE